MSKNKDVVFSDIIKNFKKKSKKILKDEKISVSSDSYNIFTPSKKEIPRIIKGPTSDNTQFTYCSLYFSSNDIKKIYKEINSKLNTANPQDIKNFKEIHNDMTNTIKCSSSEKQKDELLIKNIIDLDNYMKNKKFKNAIKSYAKNIKNRGKNDIKFDNPIPGTIKYESVIFNINATKFSFKNGSIYFKLISIGENNKNISKEDAIFINIDPNYEYNIGVEYLCAPKSSSSELTKEKMDLIGGKKKKKYN
jgi:hypothetical protein